MLNQGLEALAALASASSSSSRGGSNTSNQQMNSVGHAPSVAAQQHNAEQTGNAAGGNIAAPPGQQPSGGQPLQQNWHQAPLTAPNLALFQGLQQLPPAPAESSRLLSMQQQVTYLNYLMNAQKQKAPNPTAAIQPNAAGTIAGLDANQALQLALSGHPAAGLLQKQDHDPTVATGTTPQVLPGSPSGIKKEPNVMPPSSNLGPPAATMPPPQASASQPISNSLLVGALAPEPATIAPQPSSYGLAGANYEVVHETHLHEKKQQKRAANRRSAQLSRKRKKQFIEELKEENDELRRKEQILRSIPDLVVVFDSSGKLWFVSESVDRFLSFTAAELEGSSFWDRLCEDSVRLLKAAFMDSLAARRPDSDTAPLGTGVWELRLVDKNGAQKVVTLNGVVHFAGERPECVCSIRPRDETPPLEAVGEEEMKETSAVSSDDSKNPSKISPRSKYLLQVKPQQSVVSSGSSSLGLKQRSKKKRLIGKRGEAVRISDSGNSSVESESGSSDEMTTGVTLS